MQRLQTMTIAAAEQLHRLTVATCAGLLVLSLAAQLASVVLRYGLDMGFLWLQDLALWSFSALLLLAIPVAIALDAHVRVDLFRERMSMAGRHRLERLATVFLLLPLFGAIAWFTLPQAIEAWKVGEISQQIGGLRGFWLIRWIPAVAAVLALVQAAARLAATTDSGGRK